MAKQGKKSDKKKSKKKGEFPSKKHQFSSEYQPENRGRPKGSRNKNAIVRDILNAVIKDKNPVTGELEDMEVAEKMAWHLIKKVYAEDQQAVTAFKEVWDRAYGKVTDKSQTDITSGGKVIRFTPVNKDNKDD